MRFMTSGILEKHTQFERVAQAASLLCAHEIPPVAWCLWSHDVAQAQSTPRKATVPFTFSRVRLEKNLAWWAEVRSRYCTAPLRYAPAHIALVRDWELMSLRLLHARPETRDAVRQGVESVFPGDTFGTRVALANAEARNMQAGVERAVREGAVLWG